MNNTLTTAQVEAAKAAGFHWHTVGKCLVVRHSSGAWVAVDEMLAQFATLLAAQQPEPRAEVTVENFGDQALAILEELVWMRYEKCRIVCQDHISALTFQTARALVAARAGEGQ